MPSLRAWYGFVFVLRGSELNRLPSGYEPDEQPLLFPAYLQYSIARKESTLFLHRHFVSKNNTVFSHKPYRYLKNILRRSIRSKNIRI